MTADDIASGWPVIGRRIRPGVTEWCCPECGEVSPTVDWREVEPYCEDCGSHDGRECPRCHKWYDHVWDGDRLVEAQPEAAREGPT